MSEVEQIAYALEALRDDKWRSECLHHQCAASWVKDSLDEAERRMVKHIERVHRAEAVSVIGPTPFE